MWFISYPFINSCFFQTSVLLTVLSPCANAVWRFVKDDTGHSGRFVSADRSKDYHNCTILQLGVLSNSVEPTHVLLAAADMQLKCLT